MTERYAHAVWCDDIRLEVGNKPSFMGVYTGALVLPSLPVTLPRLSVFVWASTPKTSPFQTLVVRLARDDGEIIAEINPKLGDLGKEFLENSNYTRAVSSFGFSFGNIVLPESCKYLVIFVETESEKFEAPKLHIQVDPTLIETLAPKSVELIVPAG